MDTSNSDSNPTLTIEGLKVKLVEFTDEHTITTVVLIAKNKEEISEVVNRAYEELRKHRPIKDHAGN